MGLAWDWGGANDGRLVDVNRLVGFCLLIRGKVAVLAANDMGDLSEAERRWREVVREVPSYRQGWRGLGETLVRGGHSRRWNRSRRAFCTMTSCVLGGAFDEEPNGPLAGPARGGTRCA